MEWAGTINPVSAVGNIFGGISTAIQNHKNRQFQREMFDKQTAYNTAEREAAQRYQTQERLDTQAFNESMYQKYNSYDAQFRQLAELGVNPNAISNIVSGVPVGQSQPMSISGATAQGGAANPLPIGEYLSRIATDSASIRLMNAQAQGQETDNKYKDRQNVLSLDEIQKRIDKMESDVDLNNALKDKTVEEKNVARETAKALMQKTPHEVEAIKAGIDKAQQEIELMKAQHQHISDQDMEQQFRNGLWSQNINPDSSALDNLLKAWLRGDFNLVQSLLNFVIGHLTFGKVTPFN